MTVAILVKVLDGIVLAADSATTLDLPDGSHQVWNNADKIFHLHRQKPVAAMTWGSGVVGSKSISTIAKDLRRRLRGKDPNHAWELPADYTIELVADRLIEYMYDELYQPFHATNPGLPPAAVGFCVAGYSHDAELPEARIVVIDDPASRPTADPVAGTDDTGWIAWAQPQGTVRLFSGYDPALPGLIEEQLDPQEWEKVEPIFAENALAIYPAFPGMPLPDAVHLAKFLVDVTVGYSHYTLGPDTVGGAVEVASMSRHEGFKWISRKHYYPPALNPEDPRHDY